MADVFLSYASVDHPLAEDVERMLAEAGLSVWWDRRLLSGENFQDTITHELQDAAVVVVLWTPTSVGSEWVYSEARRAHGQHKLVQVRGPDVTIDDLPPPFDALHCPTAEDLDTLTRTVVGRVDPTSSTGRLASPPERTVPAPAVTGNLPVALTGLVGRDGELESLTSIVAQGARLVTLTGPGGSGKSRLAVALASALANDMRDGAFFVPLVEVTEVPAMWVAIAQALELPPASHSSAGVTDWMATRRTVLVLDNLEQLAEANDVIAELLRTAPELVVVATSRSPVHVLGETVHAVPPLLLPLLGASPAEIADAHAVRMFVECARRVRSDFAITVENAIAVADVCRALDGLPLALELAAARVKLLSPAAILARLDKVLDLSSSEAGRPDRQRTLRQTIDWSFQLLSPVDQQVLAHLGVFAGGARLEALEAVVPAGALAGTDVFDSVSNLVDASFATVREDHDGEPRFDLLETIRRYGRDWLESASLLAAAEQAHTQHFYERAAELFDRRFDGAAFIRAVRSDLANFGELVARPDVLPLDRPTSKTVTYLELVGLLVALTGSGRLYATGVGWAEAALGVPAHDPLGKAQCLGRLARCLNDLVRYEECIDAVERVVEAADQAIGLPSPDNAPPWWDSPSAVKSRALPIASRSMLNLGQTERALAAAADALRTADDDPTLRANAQAALLSVHLTTRDWEAADHALEEAHKVDEVGGMSDFDELWYVVLKATLEAFRGYGSNARDRARRSLSLLVDFGDPDLLVGMAEALVFALGTDQAQLSALSRGAMSSYRARHELPVDDLAARLLDDDEQRQREVLGEDAWAAGVAAGRDRDLVSLLDQLAAG